MRSKTVQQRLRDKQPAAPFDKKQNKKAPENRIAKGATEPAPGGLGYVLSHK